MQWIFILPLVILVIGCVAFALFKIGVFRRLHKPRIIIYKRGTDNKKTDEV